MGRPLMSAALLGLGLILSSNALDTGKEYKYSYKGVMKYLVTEMTSQNPGMAFRSVVKAQKLDDTTIGVKIEDMEMAVANDRDTNWRRTDGMAFEKNEKLNSFLAKPFTIHFAARKDGMGMQFEHMEVPADDPIWSVNIKKGLASMANYFVPQNDEHTYTSHESTTQGDCMVHWNILHRPHPTNPEAMVLNLTKVINHDKCTTVSGKLYGSLRAGPCAHCESVNTHPLSMDTKTTFNLVAPNKDRKNLILESAMGQSTVMHAPYTENGNVVKLMTYQRMNLLETTDAGEKLTVSGEKKTHKNLNMMFEEDSSFKRPINMREAHAFVAHWDMDKPDMAIVTKMFNDVTDLGSDNQLGVFQKKDPAKSLNDLMYLMELLDYEQLEAVFNEVVKKGDDKTQLKMQSAFVDIVAAMGSNPGMQIIMDKIQSGDIDTRFTMSFLKNIEKGMIEHTHEAINSILNFCKSDIMAKFPKERMSCMLTYTALVDESCRLAAFAPTYAHEECHGMKIQNEIFDKMVPAYEEASKQSCEHMEAYIHMAANLKTHNAVHFLQKVIMDKDTENFRRMDALRGLMMIMPRHMEMIRKIAVEIFLDNHRPYDVRILASVIIMRSNPPLSLLQTMTNTIVRDKSDQLRTFVVSMIKSVDQNEHPCFRDLAQHIRYVAPKVAALMPSEWKRKDYLTSHIRISAGYDKKFDYGGHHVMSLIMAEDSYLPREVYMGYGNYFANFMYDRMGITVRQQGMDKLTDFWHSPRTMGTKTGRNLWNFAGRRRLARDAASAKQKNDEIESTLNIKTKEYDPMRLEMIVHAFGHDLKVLKMNESHFQGLMSPEYKPGTMLNRILSTDRDSHRYMNLHDLTFMVPTSFGLPAAIEVKMPAVISYKRHESSFDMDKKGVLKLKLNRHYMIDMHLIERFGVAIPFKKVHFGAGMDKRVALNMPLNLDADANLATGKMTFNRKAILPRDVLDYHFTPFTFGGDWEKDERKPLFKDEEVKHFKHELFGDMLGVNMNIEGLRLPDDAISQDFTNWMWNSNLRQKFLYWVTNPMWHPRKLHVSLTPAETDATTGRTMTIKHKMTPPEAAERPTSNFEEFQGDLQDSFVHVIHVTDELVGSKKRQVDMEMRYSYTPDRKNHWVQMFYDRTPFSSKDKDHTKMCMVAKMTQTITEWRKLNKEQVAHINDDQKIDVKMDLNYGKNCKTGAEIHANIAYEHSEQQKEWLKELETGVTKSQVHGMDNPYMENYKTCVEWLGKGLRMPIACHKFIVHSSQLNKMTVDIGFDDQVKMHENPWLSTVFMRLKSRYYPHLRLHMIRPNATPGRIHIESTVREPCIDSRVADIKFDGPRHTSVWKSVPVSWGAHWAPKTATHLGMTNMQSYSRRWYHRFCDIQKNSIRTFDRAIMNIPETTCWKVMAKDCSPHKLFTVLTRDNNGNKELKMIIDTHEIEMRLEGDKMVLTMDGTTEEIPKNGPAKVVTNERGITTMIILNKEGMMQFESPVYGLHILQVFDAVWLQTASFYRGKLCGLCGNFNLERQHERHTTDGCHHHDDWSFARNFVLPDATCTVPDLNPDTPKPTCPK